MSSRETEPIDVDVDINRNKYRHRHRLWPRVWIEGEMRERDFKELAHMIMETEKSHDWLSTSWRPWDTSSVAQPKSEGLRTQGLLV